MTAASHNGTGPGPAHHRAPSASGDAAASPPPGAASPAATAPSFLDTPFGLLRIERLLSIADRACEGHALDVALAGPPGPETVADWIDWLDTAPGQLLPTPAGLARVVGAPIYELDLPVVIELHQIVSSWQEAILAVRQGDASIFRSHPDLVPYGRAWRFLAETDRAGALALRRERDVEDLGRLGGALTAREAVGEDDLPGDVPVLYRAIAP